MKKNLLLSIVSLTFIITSNLSAQNQIYIIGQKKYECTKTSTLKSNASFGYDLDVTIAKNESAALLIVNAETDILIKGELIIYLEDGNVINCVDRKKYDQVDNTSTNIYSLTSGEIEKIKSSNIAKIRFSLKCGECIESSEEGNYSVSNKESIDFSELLKQLFN